MSPAPLAAIDRQRIFEEQIAPTLIDWASRTDAPELTIAIGQPGAAANRIAGLGADRVGAATLTARDLAAFHPDYDELRLSRTPDAASALTEATTAWMRSGLERALTHRCSLLLDGSSFNSVDVALATAGLFAQSGFETHVSVVAVPRCESVLAAASKYLLDLRAGRPAQLISVRQHDAGQEYARSVVRALETAASVDRLSIVGRDGTVRFDREQSSGFDGASEALATAQASLLPASQARRWLSELRATTDYALAKGQIPRPLADVLVELHQIGFSDVVPAIALPNDSQARPLVEATLGTQLIAVRGAVQPDRRIDSPTGPVIAPPTPDIGISR